MERARLNNQEGSLLNYKVCWLNLLASLNLIVGIRNVQTFSALETRNQSLSMVLIIHIASNKVFMIDVR